MFEYIVAAIHLIANEGRKLLPLYRYDPQSGLWRHERRRVRPAPTLDNPTTAPTTREPDSTLARHLEEALRIVRDVETAPPGRLPGDPVLSRRRSSSGSAGSRSGRGARPLGLSAST